MNYRKPSSHRIPVTESKARGLVGILQQTSWPEKFIWVVMVAPPPTDSKMTLFRCCQAVFLWIVDHAKQQIDCIVDWGAICGGCSCQWRWRVRGEASEHCCCCKSASRLPSCHPTLHHCIRYPWPSVIMGRHGGGAGDDDKASPDNERGTDSIAQRHENPGSHRRGRSRSRSSSPSRHHRSRKRQKQRKSHKKMKRRRRSTSSYSSDSSSKYKRRRREKKSSRKSSSSRRKHKSKHRKKARKRERSRSRSRSTNTSKSSEDERDPRKVEDVEQDVPKPDDVKNGDAQEEQKANETTIQKRRTAMVPMSREEYEAQQKIVREVYDPETGRTRLVRGTGEIIERIVSREDHLNINKRATAGDGASFMRGISGALGSRR